MSLSTVLSFVLTVAFLGTNNGGVNAQFAPPFPEYQCEEVTPISDLNLDQFVSSTWYIQQQARNTYLASNSDTDECVRVDFEIRTEPTTNWGYTMNAQFQSATIAGGGDTAATVCASQEDGVVTSGAWSMAGCLAPPNNDFWILAYDETEGYALVSGGQISYPSLSNGLFGEWNGYCSTSSSRTTSELWIMTRDFARNDRLIDNVRVMAEAMGIDVSVLDDVNHVDCSYSAAAGDAIAGGGEEGAEEEDNCEDQTGSITTFIGKRNCDWVARRGFFMCFFYSDVCPETCGICE